MRVGPKKSNRQDGGCGGLRPVHNEQMEISIRERVTDAIHYWEPRRIVYNAVLAAIVLLCVWWKWPVSKHLINFELLLAVFVMAVLANVAYCAAYVPDVFVQASGYRDWWQKYRVLLFTLGTLFAGVFTRWFALGLLSGS
jgi:hypothetical protein